MKDKLKIAIIGAGQVGKNTMIAAAKSGVDVMIVAEPENTIVIDGKTYAPRDKRQSSKYGKSMSMLIGISMMMGADLGLGGGGVKERPKVNIVSEFELIQQKKSQLSRNNRDWVVSRFFELFKIVKK